MRCAFEIVIVPMTPSVTRVLVSVPRCPKFPCGGDEFEPNDRQGEAAPLTELTTVVNAVICEGDRDWYEIEIVDGADIEILLSFEEGFVLMFVFLMRRPPRK